MSVLFTSLHVDIPKSFRNIVLVSIYQLQIFLPGRGPRHLREGGDTGRRPHNMDNGGRGMDVGSPGEVRFRCAAAQEPRGRVQVPVQGLFIGPLRRGQGKEIFGR